MTAVRIRLLRDSAPPRPDGSAVRFGLQDKKGALHDGVVRADGLVQFDFDVTVTGSPDQGPPDFGGPFVNGARGERFVYLSWERLNGTGFMNRIKVRLTEIDWAVIGASADRPVEADLQGTATGGGNRPVEWRVV
jgi:hypothetical protein